MNERLKAADILAAYERIKGYVYKTPLERSMYLSNGSRNYYFKLESLQSVKSFKIRGAISRMTVLSEEEKARGVATISTGNNGAAVSYAAKLLGIEKAVVICPTTTPKAKLDKIKYYGAQIVQLGENIDRARALGFDYVREYGMTYIDPCFNDEVVYAGQGTVGLEILKQNQDIDTIVVPIGGGGLITGIAVAAKHIKPDVRIIGVQTEVCPAFIKAFEDNVFYGQYPISGPTVCDALVGGVGKLSFEILRGYVDDIVKVKEDNIRKAISHMARKEKFVVEGGAAVTLAAVMEDPDRIGGREVALVMSGGNIDGDLLTEILNEYKL